MAQRQLLTGGVLLNNVLPAPTVFAEPSELFFVNRDDTASMTQTPAIYTNIAGLNGSTIYFGMWFAGVYSALSDATQDFTANPTVGYGTSRPAASRAWRTTLGYSFVAGSKTTLATTIEMGEVSPLGQIRASAWLAIPRDDIGIENQDAFFTFISNYPAGYNDVDAIVPVADIDVQSTEDYIVFWNMSNQTASNYERNFRFTPRIDDEDIVHVRSDSTSGGATRSGRGFSIQKGPTAVATTTRDSSWSGVSVMPLEKGMRSLTFRTSIWENENSSTENRAIGSFNVFRKSLFEQAKITKISSKIQNTSETHLDTPLEVAINSTKKVAVIVSSSYMSSQVDGPEVQLWRENAGGGGGVELVQPIELQGEANVADAAAGTDRDLYPLWMFYVDDNPGDVVYKLRLGRANAGAATNTINVRDDGTDGFDGYIMALELSFGTDT